MAEFLSGVSLALSVAAFVFAVLSYKRQNYTPGQVQGMVNGAMQYAYDSLSRGQVPLPMSVPGEPPKESRKPAESEIKEGKLKDGDTLDPAEFFRFQFGEFNRQHPHLANQYGMRDA